MQHPPDEASPRATLVERRLVATLLHSADLSRTLEVGTGEGRLTYLLAGRSDRMFGIDLDGQRIRTLRNRLAGDGVEIGLARADARWLPFADGAFSTVVLVRVLHRFADATALLKEIRRVMRPNGFLLLSAVTRPSPATLGRDIFATFQGSPRPDWSTSSREPVAVIRSHAHPGYLLTRSGLIRVLGEAGFEVAQCRGTGWEDLPVLRLLPLTALARLPDALGAAPLAPTYFLLASAR